MQDQPFTDVLGPYYIEIGSKFSRDLRGEFYTPKPVCDLMAKMIVDAPAVIEAGKPITACDPAVGSGGLVLSVAAEFAADKAVDLLRVTCKDISRTACDMAYINLTLWGIPARIVQGDTLRNTVEHEWKNLHWFRVGEHQREKIEHMIELLRSPPTTAVQSEPKEQPSTGEGEPLGGHHRTLALAFHQYFTTHSRPLFHVHIHAPFLSAYRFYSAFFSVPASQRHLHKKGGGTSFLVRRDYLNAFYDAVIYSAIDGMEQERVERLSFNAALNTARNRRQVYWSVFFL